LINFDCPTCGKAFSVDEKNAGLRGRCPSCKAVIKIPEISQNELELVGDNLFSDKKLNELYSYFLEHNENEIIRHNIIDGEEVEIGTLTIYTNGLRSQTIMLYKLSDNFLGFFSIIGAIMYEATAVAALRSVNILSPCTLSLNEDNQLVVSAVKRLDNLDVDEFSDTILAVAKYADALEEAIFGVDEA